HIDLETPWEEIWQAMETLVRQGKVVYVGSSNFAGWNIAQAQETASARHFQGLISEQSLYNLIERRIEMEVLPAAREYGVGLIAWSPLMRGALGGILRKQKEGRSASEQTQQVLDAHRDQIERYEALCDEIGSHPADVGLAWLLEQPGVTAPIIGPRTLAQLESNLGALEVHLDDSALEQLDAIFPPVGRSPQAYAW
ncbi:MAG TPA: aldo/keto reductase, partial [Candidatus Deferrimicrobium sp.]|nr:aldo/keto reductase [Candidatus Deferrimicrobium sp.]